MRNCLRRTRLLHSSEAASIGLHATAVLAGAPESALTARAIAEKLSVSEAHLAKVLAVLERSGLVSGTRGPTGGYRLARPADRITLKEVYEAIDGPLEPESCPFSVPVCDGTKCVLGAFFGRLNREVTNKLLRTRVSDILLTRGGKHGQT